MSATWKTIPLFISSTFRDMHAERDQLNRVVFPAIEERLKPRRCRIAPIDLRVGVETDSTQTEREREMQILKVCLAEIERSRPFLLVLLGDRYGWVPGADRIQAAASEAGFTPDDSGGSVTALEIEYGLLKKDPIQRRRCLLCLREPLPYSQMPADKAIIYSDAHATDPGAPDRVARLKKLKTKITADPEIAPHRQPYTLDWDTDHQHPTAESVEAWGRKMEAELWKLLDSETARFAAQAEPTWQEQERFAIEEQVERLNGSFVGRQLLVQQALGLAGSVTAQGAATGIVFTGGSGAGKSALFARLHHELSQSRDILLLSHAAGVSPRSGQTEWMLRRWIGELGVVLGETPDLPENLKPEDLEKLFARMLAQVAQTRRVVVLVDALNQFLRTERARTVSWLPTAWPVNARFIATTIPGEESAQLALRPGLALVDVPPLDSSEAEAIAAQVYGRYRRAPNADVLHAMFVLRQSDGAPAAGNPLWLTLALDLLNLLDADDFTAAEATVGGSPEEKLRHLVVDRARALPPDMEGLYGRLLAQVEKVAGTAETRSFAALTALSRHGWREEDLQHLLPKAAGLLAVSRTSGSQPSTLNTQLFAWDALRFAVLRRCFRAHLVKRGALEQWDFTHASLRRAMLARLDGVWKGGRTESLPRALYSCSADYLETLPPGTGVRDDEIMWQMLGTRDAARVARYYAQPTSGSKMLALFLAEDDATAGHPLRQFVRSLVQSGVTEASTQAVVANKFTFDLNDALEIEGHLPLRKKLLSSAQTSQTNLAAANPSNAGRQHDLSASHNKLGDVLRDQGDLAGALLAYRESLAVTQRLAAADPSDPGCQRDFFVSHIKLGDVLRAQGDLAGALLAYRESLAVSQRLVAADPSNADWQRDLSVSHNKLGDVLRAQGDLAGALLGYRESLAVSERLAAADPSNADWQYGLDIDFERISSVLQAQGDLAGARVLFQKKFDIICRLAAANPSNLGWQRDISVSQEKLGEILSSQGDLAGAQAAYGESLTIRQRLAAADPSNTVWQRDLNVSHGKLGEILSAQGNLAGALVAYRESLAVSQRLVATDPSNAIWQRDLFVSHIKLGGVLRTQGDLAGALLAYRESLELSQQMAAADPSNLGWQFDVSVSQERLGDVLSAQGDLAGALAACREVLAVRQRLAAADPSNSDWQSALSTSNDWLGNALSAQGDLAGALTAYREALVVRQRLAAADSSNADWQHSLSVSHVKLGEILSAQGDLGGALVAYREALAIFQRLAAADPSNLGWQRDLSVSQEKLGEILSSQGDLAGALVSYREALAAIQRLAATDPSNAAWQRDLSVSHNKLGDVLSAQGDLAGALAAYREALAVIQRLAAVDLSNPGWQRDLFFSHTKVGVVLSAQGDLAEALAAYREALAVSQRLAVADPSNADWQRDLWVSYGLMAMMTEETGSDEAAQWWRKAYETLFAMKQRGIMLPADEQYLVQFRQKTGR
jgi:tetratricopeptide (TPR) repeat protein